MPHIHTHTPLLCRIVRPTHLTIQHIAEECFSRALASAKGFVYGLVYLHNGDEGSIQIIRLRRLAIKDLDGEGASRHSEDRTFVKVF